MWIQKLQQLPERKRKVILWAVLIMVALALLGWWVNGMREAITKYGQ